MQLNDNILIGLKKIDLSYNSITNDIFFDFIENNKGLLNLKSLNLSGNQLNDKFFEKYLNLNLQNILTQLVRIRLNDNNFGDEKYTIDYGDFTISDSINRIRLLYKFISENKNLAKLYIVKNCIFDNFGLLGYSKNNSEHFKRDEKGDIIINCLNSFLWKIKYELLYRNEGKYYRKSFNIKFDCLSGINQSSEEFMDINDNNQKP